MARGLPAWMLVFTIALAVACGKRAAEPEEAPPAAPIPAPDTAAAAERDTTPDTLFVAVDLPEAFPADFPIAPESTVVEARSARDGDGDLSQITLVTRGDAEALVAWYHEALEAAGWQVMAGEGRGGAPTLHATQAESYIDLAVQIHPELAGWLVTTAEIWKTAL